MSLRALLFIFLGVFATAACTPQKESSAQSAPPIATPETALTVHDWLPLTLGDKPIRIQFAIAQSEMARGLMYRKELAENDGMIFIYDAPRQMHFWMKNTPLPLDIGYFSADGVLREIYRMFPYDTTNVSSVRDDIQFAVEMNQGWYAKNGIKPGMKLDMEQLKDGMRKRGHDPANFGL